MCKWGTDKKVTLCKPLKYSNRVTIKVDSCIASIVQALNDSGIQTVASCCGHNKRPGTIALAGGRELFILPDYDSARKLDLSYPDIWGEIEKEQEETQ